MASGLAALLDDIAAIAKLAAASVDDIGAAAGKASVKAAGVVVDDAAVTPAYAMGFTPERELPIVGKIALGSLRNKFLFLMPGALLLSAFAPWAVTPILMVGGAYLAFEATEKIIEAFHKHEIAGEKLEDLALSSQELEAEKVSGAIRTDLILSAEIMAISLASVQDEVFAIRAAALAVTALVVTGGVYGVVGLIVKMDDIGLHLAQRRSRRAQAFGRGLVKSMPVVLSGLSVIGTAAMLWVGGGIILHGLHELHLTPLPLWVEYLSAPAHQLPGVGALAAWLIEALCGAAVGLVIGAAIVGVVHLLPTKKAATGH
jgi:predicted DNA repair protein MutK